MLDWNATPCHACYAANFATSPARSLYHTLIGMLPPVMHVTPPSPRPPACSLYQALIGTLPPAMHAWTGTGFRNPPRLESTLPDSPPTLRQQLQWATNSQLKSNARLEARKLVQNHTTLTWLQKKSRERAAARRAAMNEDELAAHRTLHNAHAAAYRQRNRRILRHNASEYRRQKKAAQEAAEERERLESEIAELEAQAY
ncbi:hypothetical protein H0H92_014807 [Tricholoma furcatifolium]|nr:hypothetical protein H0H92_014807 [Tricholoma furcatifolium]